MARIGVVGQSGTGKSWGGGALLERVLDPQHPENPGETFDIALHFDPEDEEGGLSDADNRPLFRRLDVDAQLASRLDWLKVLYNHRRLRIVPDMREEQMAEFYGVLCGAVFKLCKDAAPDLTAFVSGDEAGQYVKQHGADDRVLTLQSRGRKYGVETLHSCQRPQQMHSEIISQSDRRIYFRVTDDNDLAKINKMAGFNANKLENLDDREVIIENKSTGDTVRDSTNNWTRLRPHYAGDDGIADAALPV